ncbi:MAG TPA: MAE_28990/MAE_18760 family HEPN-like nuclease [Geothrix sp.]|jgi:hypothetical protein
MATFLSNSLESFQERWQEIQTLNRIAIKSPRDSKDYDTLCRAIIVLMVAHFEGIIRDCVRAIIDDFNNSSTFQNLPNSMKRIICRDFVAHSDEIESKDLEGRIQKLITQFNSLNPNFSHEVFLKEGKNPSPSIIHKVALNFGIKSIFNLIKTDKSEIVFQEEKRKSSQLKRRIKEQLENSASSFPYTINARFLKFNTAQKFPSPTLWEDFINNLLAMRNGIAHGSSIINEKSIAEIINIQVKLEILEYLIIYTLCVHATQPNNTNRA